MVLQAQGRHYWPEPYNVAAEAKVPFLSIAGSDFVKIYAGESAC